jgi:phosphoribosyl-dephospho-CoA transferase
MFSRHELVWLTPSGWHAVAGQAQADLDAIEQWRERDWPAVVCRRSPGLAEGSVSIGLPLPPAADGAKRRCGANVPAAAVARRQAPLPLSGFCDNAPAEWRRGLTTMLLEGATLPAPIALAVFGSCAMQVLTGQAYLRGASDIDLLLYPRSMSGLHAGLALLLRHASTLPLDGEIVFPDGAAVSWKEWAGARDERVLVKTIAGVQLAPKASLLATLEAR